MNVADLVRTATAEHGDRIAFRTLDSETATWAEIDARVDRAAESLITRGVRLGDRIAVVLPNSIDFAVAFWGALRAGAIVVPANPAYTPRELTHILTDSTTNLAITTPELHDRLTEAAPSLPLLNATDLSKASEQRRADDQENGEVAAGRRGGADSGCRAVGEAGPLSEAKRDAQQAAAQTEHGPPPEGTAVICYTSGTTGVPKGAQLTHANFLSNLDAFAQLPALRLTEDDVLLGLLPFFHIFGLNVILNAAARHGASVLVMDRFSPTGSLEAMAQHGVTVAYGAPPVFAAWCAAPPDQTPALPRLRAAVSGADSLPERTWHAFHDRLGVAINESYGLTETAPGLTSNAAAPQPRPGTVGMPLPGVELRLRDTNGNEPPHGQPGEILARGPNVFAGYHGQPEATREAIDGDGWFRTGDLGQWDDEGYLRIIGRLKDLIIVSGFNVYPREVETVLLEHPGIGEAAVVGVPDPRTGERVRAVVVPAPHAAHYADPHADATPETGLDEARILAHCRERLARYKLPREVVIVPSLPRRTTGKVARDLLRTVETGAPIAG